MLLYFPCDEVSIGTADSCCCTGLLCFISLKLRWCLLCFGHCSVFHTYSHTFIRTPCLYHLGSSLRLQHFFFLLIPSCLVTTLSTVVDGNRIGRGERDNFQDHLMADCLRMWWQGKYSQGPSRPGWMLAQSSGQRKGCLGIKRNSAWKVLGQQQLSGTL